MADLMEDVAPLDIDGANKEKIEPVVENGSEKAAKILRYTKEEILQYRNSPLATERPIVKDPSVDSSACWLKPARCLDEDLAKRRSGLDPRERTRREAEGWNIVLSPQRGNFNNGCAVPPQQVPPHRRIGSGRLLNRDWDGEESIIFRGPGIRDDRSDLRNGINNQEYEGRAMWSKGSSGGGGDNNEGRYRSRYNDDKRPNRHSRNNETPEWFSGGPTSQNDTIDLHGFDVSLDSEKTEKELEEPKEQKKRDSSPKAENSVQSSQKDPDSSKSAENEVSSTTRGFNFEYFLQNDILSPLLASNDSEPSPMSSRFSQFFNAGTTHEGGNVGEIFVPFIHGNSEHGPTSSNDRSSNVTSGMALMEFFKREHPQQYRGPSIKDLAATGKITSVEELEAEMRRAAKPSADSTSITSPDVMALMRQHEDDRQAVTTSSDSQPRLHPNVLHLMRQQEEERRNMNIPHNESVMHLEPDVLSLMQQEEERRAVNIMAPQDLANQANVDVMALMRRQEEDQEAFRRMERSRQIQMQQARQFEMEQNMLQHQPPRPPPAQQQLSLILLPHNQFVPAEGFAAMPPELHFLVINTPPSPDILSRPECASLIAALKQGAISPQQIVDQLLKNPGMPPRQKEVMLCVLNVVLVPPRPSSPIVSPRDPVIVQPMVFPNGIPQQRMMPPIDLMAHTASIMQHALIKKKLEEQLENFKKRQRESPVPSTTVPQGPPPVAASPSGPIPVSVTPQRNDHPNGPHGGPMVGNISTTLSFTPTAVLRKMTAAEEKEFNRRGGRGGGIAVDGESPAPDSSRSSQPRSPSSPVTPSPRSPVCGTPKPMAYQQIRPQNLRPIAKTNGAPEARFTWSPPPPHNFIFRGNPIVQPHPRVAYVQPIPLPAQHLSNFRPHLPVPQTGFMGQCVPPPQMQQPQQQQQHSTSPSQQEQVNPLDGNRAWWTPEGMAQVQRAAMQGPIRSDHPNMISAEDLERRQRPAEF